MRVKGPPWEGLKGDLVYFKMHLIKKEMGLGKKGTQECIWQKRELIVTKYNISTKAAKP